MHDGTVTLTREQLEKIRHAFSRTIDTNVHIQKLCSLGEQQEGVHNDITVCFESIEMCVEIQEALVCEANDLVRQLLRESCHA